MNVSEDYDDKVECLNMHPDLLPPAYDGDKLLASGSVVLVKALKQQVAPRKDASDSVVLKPWVVRRKVTRNNLVLVKALEKQVAPHKA